MEDFEHLRLPVYIEHNLDILFCGINPGRVSALAGHYFANPGNLFWKALHLGGLTPYQFRPDETPKLLDYRYGITDIVARPTRTASKLTKKDMLEGAAQLEMTIKEYRPKILCFVGITAFRHAFQIHKDKVKPGLQEGFFYATEDWQGCRVFVAPSTSGLNAGFSREERIGYFKQLNECKHQILKKMNKMDGNDI